MTSHTASPDSRSFWYGARRSAVLLCAPALLLLLSACQDFLDRQPLDAIVEDNFFETAEDMERAALAMYAPLQDLQWAGQGWRITEVPSDNSQAGGTDPDFTPIDDFTVAADNIAVAGYWAVRYRAVALANVLIARAPAANITPAQRERLDAEGRFIRALAYFDLVRIFGAVPMPVDEVRFGDDVLLPRTPRSEVYELIVADLNAARAGLPDVRASSEVGRPTSGAATALLAKVQLTLGAFREARELASELINSGRYELAEDFSELWDPATSDAHPEAVFQIQHAGCGPFGTGNAMQAFFAPFGEGITKDRDGWGSQIPTGPAVNNPGTGLMEAFTPEDLRRDETIMTPGTFYPNINPSDGGYTYPSQGASRVGSNIKKYVIGAGPEVCFMSTPQNVHVIRYTDVLLTLAEAAARLDGGVSVNADAVAAFNAVRERAGLEAVDIVTIDDVFAERRLEHAFEGHRWFDLLRTGNAIEIMRLHGKGIEERNLLFPIPSAELRVNTNLTQNPGY